MGLLGGIVVLPRHNVPRFVDGIGNIYDDAMHLGGHMPEGRMTLPELLEELKAVDPDTAEDIGNVVNVISIKSDGSFTLDAYYPDFIIQGCIQRACERREWYAWKVGANPYLDQKYRATIGVICESHISDHIVIDDIAVECGDSPAEALLAAYIAAVKMEAKR